jgi:hypothetical protein
MCLVLCFKRGETTIIPSSDQPQSTARSVRDPLNPDNPEEAIIGRTKLCLGVPEVEQQSRQHPRIIHMRAIVVAPQCEVNAVRAEGHAINFMF